MEKQQQVGCMAGLLQIFDRQQFLAGKRVYATTKRLASSAGDSIEKSEDLPSPEKKEQNATEGVKSPWKFRECPRLSLDSQAIIDNKGSVYPRPREIRTKGDAEEQENEKQRRSPGVVARLMGLDMMPTREPLKKQPELRRSNSDSNSTHLIQQQPFLMPHKKVVTEFPTKKTKFETQDFYRQVKEKGVVYGELEKRLKVRGISEPVEDLESLNQILQALQLKGLLHSRRRNVQHNITNRNFDQKSPRPSIGNQSPPSNLRSKTAILRNGSDALPPTPSRLLNKSVSENERRFSNSRSPEETNARSPSRRNKPLLAVESRRRRNDSVTHSPKIISPSPRNKNSSDKLTKSPRNNTKSLSLSPTIQPGRFKAEGKSLLERCDKLLNSIAEISTPESQPSPVSVLDSSFYKDELSPLKRCIEFKDQSIELEEHNWSPLVSSVRLNQDDADFDYVWKIVQASNRGYVKSDLFLSLEKESHNSKCSVSSLHRKLGFDTIMEILDKKKQLPPPKATGKPSFKQVWTDYSKIREPPPVEEDMFEVVCRVLIKDLADETISGWGNWGIEKSEMVLDIERLIFKDLVGDTIQELATFRKCRSMVPKKLVF